jgi:hypothetical protein
MQGTWPYKTNYSLLCPLQIAMLTDMKLILKIQIITLSVYKYRTQPI